MPATLVIGATGILRPAAAELVARGGHVVGVSRTGGEVGGVVSVAVDATDAAALAAALADLRWDDALVYAPAVSVASLSHVRARTPRRTVLVRTSGAADPAHGVLIVPRDTLQLGWTEAATDEGARWHTPDEVSRAALEVLASGEAATLGTVRPWSDRP
jgi:hypothetical protein